MRLKDMTIGEILRRVDFTDAFIEKFKNFCEGRPTVSDPFWGVNRSPVKALPYSKNSLLEMMPKEEKVAGGSFPVSVGNKDADK